MKIIDRKSLKSSTAVSGGDGHRKNLRPSVSGSGGDLSGGRRIPQGRGGRPVGPPRRP